MKESTALGGRNIRYIVIVVLGSLLLGMGVNLLLVYTGVVTGDSFKTEATVLSCDATDCAITYDRAGRLVEATLEGSRDTFSAGTTTTVTVYENDETSAYPERVIPLGFAITVAVVGLMITVFGSIRLFRIWRAQVLAADPTKAPDSPVSSSERDK